MLAFARSNAKESDCILIQGVVMTILPSIMSTSHLAQGCRAGVNFGFLNHANAYLQAMFTIPRLCHLEAGPCPRQLHSMVGSTSLAKTPICSGSMHHASAVDAVGMGNLASTHMRRVHFSLQAWKVERSAAHYTVAFGRPRTSEFAAPRKGLPRHPSLELSLRAEPNRW